MTVGRRCTTLRHGRKPLCTCPKHKEVVAEIQSLISEKNERYNDYHEKSDRLHELMTMQRNYQMAMPQQPKHGRKHEQER